MWTHWISYNIGSGWAFAATGAIEAVNAMVTRNLVSLSEQELVDCVEKSRGCYNGWHDQSYEWVVQNGGINTEADYPYTAEDGICNANKVCDSVTEYIYMWYLLIYFYLLWLVHNRLTISSLSLFYVCFVEVDTRQEDYNWWLYKSNTNKW